MEDDNLLSEEDRAAFHGFMLMWQDMLNLHDWRIILLPQPSAKHMAEVLKRDLPQRLASYKIGRSFGAVPVSADSLEEIAIHEMLHIFLNPLIEAAKDARTLPEDLESLEHAVINVLVPLLKRSR